MKRKHLIPAISAILLSAAGAQAQSLLDLQLFGQQGSRQQEKSLKLEYGADFQYYMDYRDMSVSEDLFMDSGTFNIARLSPSVGFSFNQGRNSSHRLIVGIDLVKTLGETPIEVVAYSKGEDDPKLNNISLFKEIFYYYNIQSRLGNGLLSASAGIFPRTFLKGEYSRVHFSDSFKVRDVNIEGVLVSYKAPRLYAEIALDRLGKIAVERRERMMISTAGSYSPLKWASAGWSGTYMYCGESYLEPYSVQDLILNPYLKFEFGHMTGMDELSLKAGAIASLQVHSGIEEAPHIPVGAEAVITARKWGFGIEDTFFYGDNMMPFRADNYATIHRTGEFNYLLYTGDPFYYTHRGYAASYNRTEVFWQPHVADFLDIRVSGIAHCIFPTSAAFGSFMGWQARASLFFSLDALRNPEKAPARQSGRRQRRAPQGPSIIL